MCVEEEKGVGGGSPLLVAQPSLGRPPRRPHGCEEVPAGLGSIFTCKERIGHACCYEHRERMIWDLRARLHLTRLYTAAHRGRSPWQRAIAPWGGSGGSKRRRRDLGASRNPSGCTVRLSGASGLSASNAADEAFGSFTRRPSPRSSCPPDGLTRSREGGQRRLSTRLYPLSRAAWPCRRAPRPPRPARPPTRSTS